MAELRIALLLWGQPVLKAINIHARFLVSTSTASVGKSIQLSSFVLLFVDDTNNHGENSKNCLHLAGVWTICLCVIFLMTTMRAQCTESSVTTPGRVHRGKLNTSELVWYCSRSMYGRLCMCARQVLKAMLELLNDESKILQTLNSHPRKNQPSYLPTTGANCSLTWMLQEPSALPGYA